MQAKIYTAARLKTNQNPPVPVRMNILLICTENSLQPIIINWCEGLKPFTCSFIADEDDDDSDSDGDKSDNEDELIDEDGADSAVEEDDICLISAVNSSSSIIGDVTNSDLKLSSSVFETKETNSEMSSTHQVGNSSTSLLSPNSLGSKLKLNDMLGEGDVSSPTKVQHVGGIDSDICTAISSTTLGENDDGEAAGTDGQKADDAVSVTCSSPSKKKKKKKKR